MRSVLTIAGSDSSGGAGVQADIKTITAHRLFATCAITALTAQNTMGVSAVMDVAAQMIVNQMGSVFEDIFPDAVKIGVISSWEAAEAIDLTLGLFGARNIVVDPVMVATSGSVLTGDTTAQVIADRLFTRASIITPNIPEAEFFAGEQILHEEDIPAAATEIANRVQCGFWHFDEASRRMSSCIDTSTITTAAASKANRQDKREGGDGDGDRNVPYILIKGGHAQATDGQMFDYLRHPDGFGEWIGAPYVETINTHGTGCTLSSAIACGLACGLDVPAAVRSAKKYITGALDAELDLGRGSGPVNHMWKYM